MPAPEQQVPCRFFNSFDWSGGTGNVYYPLGGWLANLLSVMANPILARPLPTSFGSSTDLPETSELTWWPGNCVDAQVIAAVVY
jgi:hypothetical protein